MQEQNMDPSVGTRGCLTPEPALPWAHAPTDGCPKHTLGPLAGAGGQPQTHPTVRGAPLLLKTAHKGFGPMAIRVMLGGYTDGKRVGPPFPGPHPQRWGSPLCGTGAEAWEAVAGFGFMQAQARLRPREPWGLEQVTGALQNSGSSLGNRRLDPSCVSGGAEDNGVFQVGVAAGCGEEAAPGAQSALGGGRLLGRLLPSWPQIHRSSSLDRTSRSSQLNGHIYFILWL